MSDDPARNRFFLLTAARVSSVVLVAFGVLIIGGAIEAAPIELGYALAVIGLVELMVLPRFLARRWRSPPEQ